MNAYQWHPPPRGARLPRLEALPPGAAAHKVPRRSIETRRAYQRVETEPGLDKFADNPDALGPQALEPLLEWARAALPRASWASTPVFLLGTAGMRKLGDADRDAVMGAARGALGASGFRFEPPWARVLGGTDEGVLAWVALNAALGTLGTPNTVGSLDLGGSSLQVTFAMDDGSEALAPALNVSVLGAQHALYTHSHYHFGLDDAFERSVTLLLEQRQDKGGAAGGKGTKAAKGGAEGGRHLLAGKGGAEEGSPPPLIEVEHPCLPEGYRERYSRIPLEGRAPTPGEVTLVGRPDAGACERLARAVVAAKTDCSAPPCALGAPQPRAAGRFVALAGFYVVAHFFELGASTGVSAVRAAGREFCPRPWAAVTAAHGGEMAVETYCFRSEYVAALVSQGLGLSEDQVEIGEGSAGWTLGAALLEGHRAAGLGVAGGGGAAPRGGGGRRLGLESALPSWGGRAAAALLAVAAAGAVLLAFRRAAAAARAARGRRRRTSSSSGGILSVADFLAGGGGAGAGGGGGGAPLAGGGGTASSNGDAFQRIFGQPPSMKGEEAVGSSRSSLSRSATFARRLSALENGGAS